MRATACLIGTVILAQAGGGGCQPLNCPYPSEEEGQNIYYGVFTEPPKTLDPAVSYNANEYQFLGQIVEPPLQYHFLKRPYALEPLTLAEIPKPKYLAKDGRELSADAPADQVFRIVYECRIKPGIRWQDHPCFAKDASGKPRYVPVDPALAGRVSSPEDFPEKSSRDLTAADYLLEIRRMADPRIHCPIRETLSKYLVGMSEYTAALEKDLQKERARRKQDGGAGYNQTLDEAEHPIRLDLEGHPFPGIEQVDALTFRLVLGAKYPQILYWIAMPFFAPIPQEALDFYGQPVLAARNVTLERWPVGTGAYRLTRHEANRVLVLDRNPNFHEERYPSEGEAGDREAGYLQDAGKRLPFLDKGVYVLEKEATSNWNKFLQGYYDASGIPSDGFERAISLSAEGSPEVSGELERRRITLDRNVMASTYYTAFNMLDPVVGGYDEPRCKLRQAVGIAIDVEENIQIFRNGRGIPGMGPIPPGIDGYENGRDALNPYLYSWDEAAGCPRRKSLEEAKALLAEAGYPGGIGKDGKQLVLGFDNAMTQATDQPYLVWMQRRLALIGVHLDIRTSDYNRFQEKVHSGNFQIIPWGWNADYPDPENFLFLFYGPNARSELHGENSANYKSPEYDRLFRIVENMETTPSRLERIRQMNRMLQHDSPWVGVFYREEYTLFHSWLGNAKPNEMSHGNLKYRRIDASLRSRQRREWNTPVWTPLWVLAGGVVLLVLPAWLIARRRERRRGAC